MASTVIRGAQIKDSTVQRHDLDTSTVGQAVVTKIVQGSGITLSSTGADSGTGDVTVSGVSPPLADATQSGLLRQVSGNTTDFIDGTNNSQALQPVIWSVRLRSFNAVGNPTFEVDQANVGSALANPANNVRIADRWFAGHSAITGAVNTQDNPAVSVKIPGTNYVISRSQLTLNLATAQASLAVGDYYQFYQNIEGPSYRELSGDVNSISLLVYSSIAPVTFAVNLRDSPATKSLVNLLTISTASTWTLLTLPNLPAFPTGNFTTASGSIGYTLSVCLACGTTFQAPATGSWQTGNYLGAAGMTNWLATSASFYCAFIQHEPGSQCTTPIDCPFGQNLIACQRYYTKSYPYGTAVATATNAGAIGYQTAANLNPVGYVPFKQTMAKTPAMNIYSTTSGATFTIRDTTASVDRTVSSVSGQADGGFWGLVLSSVNAGVANYLGHYTADTGW